MKLRLGPLVVLVGLALLVSSTALFQVKQTEAALRTRFGEIVGPQYGAGLHMKWPFIDRVRSFERRIVTQNYSAETFLTSENKGLLADFYVKWRISEVAQYYRATGGIEETAAQRLGDIVKNGIKGVVAKRTLQEIVVAERAEFTGDMFSSASEAVKDLGIELIDVRIKRIDLPDEVSGSVYQRMQESFRALANRLRAEGAAEAERIRAEADRQRTEILATAQRDAQRIRGEADGTAGKIYSDAYGKSPEFYAFYRSLQAYRTSLVRDGDVWVLTPEGEFFRYLNSADGKSANGR
ncbi:MAG: protease modulator HflC [Nevskiaceae bacterium]|jgi:membrane protease subunit HflC|nr:protease modulator HflC [Nevskiaceae bacterium]